MKRSRRCRGCGSCEMLDSVEKTFRKCDLCGRCDWVAPRKPRALRRLKESRIARHGNYIAACVVAMKDDVEAGEAVIALARERLAEKVAHYDRWDDRRKRYSGVQAVLEGSLQTLSRWKTDQHVVTGYTYLFVATERAVLRYRQERDAK